MKDKWISIEDKLPLEKYHGQPVIDQFLVTVELEDKDPEDDPEVMILTFDAKELIWMAWGSGKNWKEYSWGWKVTHWMEKPKAAGIK